MDTIIVELSLTELILLIAIPAFFCTVIAILGTLSAMRPTYITR